MIVYLLLTFALWAVVRRVFDTVDIYIYEHDCYVDGKKYNYKYKPQLVKGLLFDTLYLPDDYEIPTAIRSFRRMRILE